MNENGRYMTTVAPCVWCAFESESFVSWVECVGSNPRLSEKPPWTQDPGSQTAIQTSSAVQLSRLKIGRLCTR